MAITRTGKAKEHFEKAEEILEAAFDLEPDSDEDKEERRKAIAEYTEVIKLLPNDAESYSERGSLYRELEEEEKALDDFNKAISLDPKGAIHYYRRAGLNLELAEIEKAKADIEKSVELDPAEAGERYCFFADQILRKTGNKKEAAVYYKKSVEHGDYIDYQKKPAAKTKLAELGM